MDEGPLMGGLYTQTRGLIACDTFPFWHWYTSGWPGHLTTPRWKGGPLPRTQSTSKRLLYGFRNITMVPCTNCIKINA